MTRVSPLHRLKFLPVLFVFFVFASCSSSSGVDDYYTFNVSKSQGFSVPAQIALHQTNSTPLPISIDSTDLITTATLRTNLSSIKSVKLTKLTFSPSETTYAMTNFYSVQLFISADSLTDQLLATYVGATDSVHYTNADFAAYIKKPSSHYTLNFQVNTAPTQTVTISSNTTLVFSAAPLN